MNRIIVTAVLALGIGALPLIGLAAEPPKEADLIKIIQSDAPPQDKAIPCKQLAIYGSAKAVPALAALLPDKDLSSWARIALEAIPGPEADNALQASLGKLKGRLLVGVINSIGHRAVAKASGDLAGLLKSEDEMVACAAAAALGRIANAEAVQTLEPQLKAKSAELRSTAAEALVICAEKRREAGESDETVRLCEAIRKADVPRQRTLEAIRCMALVGGKVGTDILSDLLRSDDRHMFGLGLHLAREMKGAEVTDLVSKAMGKAAPRRKALLLIALADRKDPKSIPAVLSAAKDEKGAVRVTAIELLEKMGDVSCVGVLLGAAVDEDEKVAKAARLSLARLPGKAVSDDLVARLGKAEGNTLAVLLDLTAQRQLPAALEAMVRHAGSTDAAVRSAALAGVAFMGGAEEIPAVVELVKNAKDAASRGAAEKVLTALCGRAGPACMDHLRPLARSDKTELKIVVLHALAAAGGEKAVEAVVDGAKEGDAEFVDEAVRTLSTWPNRWPNDTKAAEALLELAKSAEKPTHKVLALRGYFQFLQATKSLKEADRLGKLREAMSLAPRPQEKRLGVAALSAIGTSGALKMLTELTDDAAIAQEACAAIANLGAARNARRKFDKAVLKAALAAAAEKTKSDGIKKRAKAAMKGL